MKSHRTDNSPMVWLNWLRW